MNWSTPETEPSGSSNDERAFDAVVLRRRGEVVWVEVDDHEPLPIEFVDFTELFEYAELAGGGTAVVIASPPTAYLLLGQGTLTLEDVTTGHYRGVWLDLEAGQVSDLQEWVLDGGDEEFESPISGPVALSLLRRGR